MARFLTQSRIAEDVVRVGFQPETGFGSQRLHLAHLPLLIGLSLPTASSVSVLVLFRKC